MLVASSCRLIVANGSEMKDDFVQGSMDGG